jgi:LemA protein
MTALIVIGVLVVVVALWYMGAYNGLVQKRVGCENSWSQIDVQLKRRYDLIPNLVETVKGYTTHEKDTLERVIKARNAAIAVGGGDVTGRSQAESALSGALRQVFALSESYPDLKANTNFAQLQEEISSTENRIGFARQHYNDCVATFNTAVEQIPTNIVAGIGGFTKKAFFELSAEEAKAAQQAPKVSF